MIERQRRRRKSLGVNADVGKSLGKASRTRNDERRVSAQMLSGREMLAAWARAGKAVDEVRRKELQRYRHKDHIEIIDALFQLGATHGTRQSMTGLVEFQRLLAKARR